MATTIVRGLRDGQHTAGTGFLIRKIKALGATVSVAKTGRVTVIDRDGERHVYMLVLDMAVDNSPLHQALADLESAETKKSSRQLDREIAEALAKPLPEPERRSPATIKRRLEVIDAEARSIEAKHDGNWSKMTPSDAKRHRELFDESLQLQNPHVKFTK